MNKEPSVSDIKQLQYILGEAEAVGVPEDALAEARAVVAEEGRKDEARSGLSKALAICGIKQLQSAIDGAKAAGLDCPELDQAQKALKLKR